MSRGAGHQVVDLRGHDELAHRQRRAGRWRTVTVAVQLLLAGLPTALLLRAATAQNLLVVVVFGVAPPLVAWWLDRHRPSARKPQQWWWRSLFVSFPQAIGLTVAVNTVRTGDDPAPWQSILLVVSVALLPAGTAALGTRSLLRPLVPALGAGDFDVLVEPRTGHRPWFYADNITLTDREIVISVRSGAGRATWNPKVQRIPLGVVTTVGARPAVARDSPWITLADRRGLSVPPGDVVVVGCRDGDWVLPVEHAAAFAGMIRARAALNGVSAGVPAPPEPEQAEAGHREAGRPGAGDLPGTGHLPEVLPAPEPTGGPAHPVTGPASPPAGGPGMAVRTALGYPAALLGIVGMPLGLLVWGGLLPPDPGLERYRLVFCLLWTGLAAGIWLRSWQQPRYWPVWALISALSTALVVAVHEAGLVALLGPVVAVLLTWAGRQVLLRPIGTDLAASRLEIPLRGFAFTLIVQRDRVVLKLSAGAGGVAPQALPLRRLTLVQPGQFAGTKVHWWPYPGARWTRMGAGPVLRLVSGPQQWLVPVPAAREFAVIIRARAAALPGPGVTGTGDLALGEWRRLQSWTVQQLTKPSHGPKQRTVGWRLVAGLPAAFLGSGILTESLARGASPFSTGAPVVGIVALAIAAVLIADWFRVRRRLRVAEDNALPPGSPSWGDPRAEHAPLPGWQPWHE